MRSFSCAVVPCVRPLAAGRRERVASSGSRNADMVFHQAYFDLGLQVETSVLCADKLLVAWYHQHR